MSARVSSRGLCRALASSRLLARQPLLQASARFSTSRPYASETALPSTFTPSEDSPATLEPASRAAPSLLDPRPKVVKRPLRESVANPGLGARKPASPSAEHSQKIWLPNFKIVLCRNSPQHADDPFTATFRVPMALSKPDIVSFLTQAYGLGITGIRTLIYRGEVVKARVYGDLKPAPGRKAGFKKAVVQLTRPFWYPEAPTKKWLNEQFSIDEQQNLMKRKQILFGNPERPGYDRKKGNKYRGSHPKFIGIGARKSGIMRRKFVKSRKEEIQMKGFADERVEQMQQVVAARAEKLRPAAAAE